MKPINRRTFIKTAAVGAALLGTDALSISSIQSEAHSNPLPRWRGFNFLNFFTPNQHVSNAKQMEETRQYFQWMADWGFDFVRIPIAYPSYISYDPQIGRHITPEETLLFREEAIEAIEKVVYMAHKYKLHVSLNLHRAPGFCINAGFHEPFNLWKDEEAQKAFYTHWEMWAKRFKQVSKELLSFDLVNEPCYKEDMNDQFSPSSPIPGEIYRKVAKGCLDVIHKQTPDRLVVADGNHVGALVVPELMDLPIAQSCRGYHPHYISHYRANWVWKNPDDAPLPVWPGVIDGINFSKKTLEDVFQPWIDLAKQGVGVHCGECGCFNETPHPVFLAWFEDMLSILTPHGIGWGLWEFSGSFGVLNSGRKDIEYEDWYGHKLDRKLLRLLQKY